MLEMVFTQFLSVKAKISEDKHIDIMIVLSGLFFKHPISIAKNLQSVFILFFDLDKFFSRETSQIVKQITSWQYFFLIHPRKTTSVDF